MRYEMLVVAVLAILAVGWYLIPTKTTQNDAANIAQTTSTNPSSGTDKNPNKVTSTTIAFEEEGYAEDPTPKVILPANLTGCNSLTNQTLKDYCIFDIAGREHTIEACNSIVSGNIKLKCQARLVENSDYCDQIDRQSERDWCYRMMAFKWNKLKYCKAIMYQKIKDKCVWDFLRDKKADPFECFQIVDAPIKDQCIYYHIGLDRINPKLCYLIANKSLEAQCNQTFIQLGKKKLN